MAAPCVSCGRVLSLWFTPAVRASLCQRPGYWTASAVGWQTGTRFQLSKLIHTTVVTTKKNVQASRQESYTEDFIKKQIEEFNIGKRHLANMMGEDPETFAEEDIDRAIAYLFPSGLFEKRARPMMKHPEHIFPKQRATQWGEDGRPFHFLFYTGKQSYYSLMHCQGLAEVSDENLLCCLSRCISVYPESAPAPRSSPVQDVYGKVMQLEKHRGPLSASAESRDLIGSRWLIKEELEEMLVEKLSDEDYAQFIRLLEKLLTLPCGPAEEEFVQRFRRSVTIQSKKQLIEPVQYDEQGMAFSTSEGRRKSATAQAVVYEHGSGKIHVNGVDYLIYFPITQDSRTTYP